MNYLEKSENLSFLTLILDELSSKNGMGGGIGLRFYLSRINTKIIKIMMQDLACNYIANRVRDS